MRQQSDEGDVDSGFSGALQAFNNDYGLWSDLFQDIISQTFELNKTPAAASNQKPQNLRQSPILQRATKRVTDRKYEVDNFGIQIEKATLTQPGPPKK